MNDEHFIQRRMLMAAVLSAVVMGLYIYLVPRPQPPEQPVQDTLEETAETPAGTGAEAEPEQRAATAAERPDDADVEASDEQRVVVENDNYRVEFTNRGAVVTSWQLKQYNDALGNPLDLVHPDGAKRYGMPFRLLRPGGDPIEGTDEALFSVNSGRSV
ncbi:MAG: membrane protein insertase YidC, partial [Bryobacterales bacterium]|nr:membrane protein insertase YidC [Bryobacterales bacterium]